tara:strand:+ start:944 stop:1420 length:477 start_codon:yes stop_codon:yes gene_type:complete
MGNKKEVIEYAEYYRDGFRYLECRDCGQFVQTDVSAIATTCHECVREQYEKDFPYQAPKNYKGSGKPRGWAFMKEFVDKDGTVYHKGKEQPDLKGTLEPTKPKPVSKKPKMSRTQRANLKRQAMVTYHKLKKSLAKAKTKKAKKDIQREIRKVEKIIK